MISVAALVLYSLSSQARRWRLATGHLESFYDPLTGASLTSRVCGNDRALHVATGQASLYRLVATYLGSDAAPALRGLGPI